MQSLIRNLSSLILPILALSSGPLAQETRDARKTGEAPVTNSSVSGRVVYEDTGMAATRHRVQLIASELLSSPHARFGIPTTITNENGEFSLRRIAAGEYYVVAQAVDEHRVSSPIFPFLGRSSDRAADAAKVEQFKKDNTRITVDGQHNTTVNLRVANLHFGSISGRILDSAGTPAVRASVHFMSKGEKTFGASVLSDEQGRYKFLGLPAGEYVISTSPPVKEPGEGAPRKRYEGVLGATYFPSTLDSRNSPPVTVVGDRDTANIEVTLLARSLHSLAGTVLISGTNRPVSTAMVRLTRIETSEEVSGTPKTPDVEAAMSFYYSNTDKSGHWLIGNVPDGLYRIRVQPNSGKLPNEKFVPEEQDVTIEGADIADLVVQVSNGGLLSGVLSIEGDSSVGPQFISLAAARLKGNAVSNVRLEAAGNFLLTAVPAGEIMLSAFPSPQDQFYVKSIEANGADLLRTNLSIGEGEEIKGVRIVVSPKVAVVTGRVLSLNGDKPIAGMNVMLRRVTDNKLRLFGGKLMGTTDNQGNFTLSAAPGVYLVLAWRASDGSTAFGAAMDKALREQGSGLTLSPNDRKQLNIRLP